MKAVKVCRQGPDSIIVIIGDDGGMLCLTDAEAGLLRALLTAVVEPPRRDIEHTSPTGRLEHAQADFAGPIVPRRRTVMHDGRGDAAPTNPADDAGDVA